MKEPNMDSTATATMAVAATDLASALPQLEPQDAFPAVLATARLVALMEVASARLLHLCLGEGEMSVGVNVDISHTAPTPEGATLTATARFWAGTASCSCLKCRQRMPAAKSAVAATSGPSSMPHDCRTVRCAGSAPRVERLQRPCPH